MFSRDILLSDSVVTQQLEECLYGVKLQLQWRLRELQLTATQHRFLMQGVKKKNKKKGDWEMNVRNLKFPQIMFTNPYPGESQDEGSVLYLQLQIQLLFSFLSLSMFYLLSKDCTCILSKTKSEIESYKTFYWYEEIRQLSCSAMQMPHDDKSNKNLFKIECRFNLPKKNLLLQEKFL